MSQRLGHHVDQVVTASGDEPLPFVALENIGSRTGSLLPDAELPLRVPEPTGMTWFREDDVLFGKLRPYLAKSWRADRTGVCSTELIVMRPRPTVDARWLGYLAQSDLLVEWAVATSEGVRMPRTSWEKLRLLELDAPSVDEQRAIADYLDAETAKIDALVASRQRMSELLDERRSAVIADLTGGVIRTGDAQVRTRLKFAVGRPTSGNRDHAFTSDDSGIPCLRGLNIKPGWVDQANLMRISEADHRDHAATILRSGDLVIVRSGNAGTAAVVPPELDGANCVDLVIIRQAATVAPRYLEYLLNSPQARTQAEMSVFGATLTHFNAVDIGELSLFIPSLPEQAALTRTLDELTLRIDRNRAAMQRQTELLIERRQALITAAVTGQLEIPGVAA